MSGDEQMTDGGRFYDLVRLTIEISGTHFFYLEYLHPRAYWHSQTVLERDQGARIQLVVSAVWVVCQVKMDQELAAWQRLRFQVAASAIFQCQNTWRYLKSFYFYHRTRQLAIGAPDMVIPASHGLELIRMAPIHVGISS